MKLWKLLVVLGMLVAVAAVIMVAKDLDLTPDFVEAEKFDEEIKIISIKPKVSSSKLYTITHSKWNPECGCVDEITLNVLSSKMGILMETKLPARIHWKGTRYGDVYQPDFIKVL